MKDIHSEVEQVLNSGAENVAFEEIPDENNSPLNQPVVEDEIGHGKKVVTPKQETEPMEQNEEQEESDEEAEKEPSINNDFDQNIYDAPEQEIGSYEEGEDGLDELDGEDFELPTGHAKQAADTLLGMTDNVLAVGSGFFVKIKKHKDFYDFEEIVQVIDEQNAKNVKRIKLDEEDKILLRPLLIAILKKKAKKLTPEQQLLGAVLSILMKKAQVVMEIRAENEILLDRILEIIREEKAKAMPEPAYEPTMEEEETEEDMRFRGESSESTFGKKEENTVLEVAQDEEGND